MDTVLFKNKYLAVIDRNGYIFSREVRCDGEIVAIVPFRLVDEDLEFLARLEICPAHGPEAELCSITGGKDQNETVIATAQNELAEEVGYHVYPLELIALGPVRPSKSADTIVHLFAIDVTDKPQSKALGDGTIFEQGSSVKWLTYEQSLEVADPLFVTAVVRLMRRIKNG